MTFPARSDEAEANIDFATLFASNIHEIKNLLFLLLSSIDEAGREPWARNEPSAQATLGRLKYGGAQISQRLAHLLALYRIAQGHYQLDIAYHEAAGLLEEIVLETRPLLGAHAVEMSVDAEEGLYGFFDREMVRGILLNAVHNALRYASGKIRLSAVAEEGYLCLRVEDDGPGFAPEVFETGPAQAKLNLKGGGTGLGLHFCATTAALHRNQEKSGFTRLTNGGAFGGAVFSLYLP